MTGARHLTHTSLGKLSLNMVQHTDADKRDNGITKGAPAIEPEPVATDGSSAWVANRSGSARPDRQR